MKTNRAVARWALGAASLLHLAALPFYAAAGLLAPLWAVIAVLCLWVAAGAVIVRLRHRPVVLAVPLISVAVWYLVVTAGENLLGWTG